MGKKRLAYPIAHQHYGYYRLVEFTAEPTNLQKLNDLLSLSSDVLRHQIVVKPVKSRVVVEREQALKARLAARRQQRARAAEQLSSEGVAQGPTISPAELDEKLEKILEENPEV